MEPRSSPAVDTDGTIYLTDENGTFYSLDFSAQEQETVFTASGNIYYEDVNGNSQPLQDTLVKINETLYDITDSYGAYSIPNIPSGVYTLYVSHPDFTNDNRTISNLAPDNNFILKFSQGLRFIQLTDAHVGPDPLCLITNVTDFGESCEETRKKSIDRFVDVSDNIIKLYPKPDFVLITGDSVEWNNEDQYDEFNTFISKFEKNNINVYIVPGNHDRRGWDGFPFLPNNDMGNYRKYTGTNDYSDRTFDQNGYRFIGLDSGYDSLNFYDAQKYARGSGLSPEQIDFTRNNILNNRTIIFMHHPAIEDDNSYNVISENRDQFINLADNESVRLVLTGHTHQSKIFNKSGNNYLTCYDRSGKVSTGSSISTCSIINESLFVQTRSATKDINTPYGYLNINIGIDKNLTEQIKLTDVKMTGKRTKPVNYVYLRSPADLHIFDEYGRHTGLNASGNIENNIPDSYYFEEYKLGNITLPAFALLYNATSNYSVKIVSNFSRENITSDQSTFNFTIESRNENSTTTINYNNVSINRNSIAYMQMNTTQANYSMQIDLDNDSMIDTTKQPDAIETDYAPAAIILSPSDNSTWDQGQPVTFNGSGIDAEEGTLNKLTWISDRDDVIGHGNFTTADLSAGVHNITLLVNDSADQVETSNIVITVTDTEPPVISMEYPPENKIFNRQNITARGFAYDDSGISSVTVNGLQAGQENWNSILSLDEGQNIINVAATDNSGFNTIANRTVYYNSSLAGDTEPPAAIKNLAHETGYNSIDDLAWINWTWDNPADADFSYVKIYMDGIPMESTSGSSFNITGLSSNASYTITVQSADIVDNVNLTGVTDTARTPETALLPPVRFINGTVVDSADRTGIQGVTVFTNTSVSSTTDASGFYSLQVGEGTYNITASFEPAYYTNGSITVSTVLGAVVLQDIELVMKPVGNVTGSVTDV